MNVQGKNNPSSVSTRLALLCYFWAITSDNDSSLFACTSLNIRYCFQSGESFTQYLLLVEEGSENSQGNGNIPMTAGMEAALNLSNRNTHLFALAYRFWVTVSALIQPYKGFYELKSLY